ncbi:MAG: fructose-6-phosphate aldolase [Nitrososphaerota archaeon]|nr:fructose-6-phosphate aldolase [Nitrososphaerota archaeon]MDG6923704.1 fructose-6-phosphate aldolase [Nitrososphaerota archaeon]
MVQIFLDTASLTEIQEIVDWGIVDGVTTNQKIFLAEGGIDFRRRVLDICNLVDGPISVETTKTTVPELVAEAREYASWHKNVVVKVAMYSNGDGLRVVSRLAKEGIKTNMTVMMTYNQLVLATKAGATYASLFYNRSKEAGENPSEIIGDYVEFVKGGGYKTRLIVGSIRTPADVAVAMQAGAHIMTIPTKILKQMPFNKRTEETIAEFDKAWQDFLEMRQSKTPVMAR